MSGIGEAIDHLSAAMVASGEGLAATAQAKDLMQAVYEKLQDAQNHVAGAMGNADIDTLNSAFLIFDSAKRAVEGAIGGLASIPETIAQGQQYVSNYIGRLQN